MVREYFPYQALGKQSLLLSLIVGPLVLLLFGFVWLIGATAPIGIPASDPDLLLFAAGFALLLAGHLFGLLGAILALRQAARLYLPAFLGLLGNLAGALAAGTLLTLLLVRIISAHLA